MTLLQLQYFEAVYQTKNMTRAAEQLFVSQPSVSNAIRELENELEVQLFLRTNPLQPTKAGEQLAAMTEPLLHDFEHLRYEMRKVGSEHSPLRIGISTIAKQLLQNENKGELEVFTKKTGYLGFFGNDYLVRCIQENRLDLAVLITVDVSELDEFHTHEIAALNVRLYTNRDGYVGKMEAIAPHEIAAIPMAVFTEYPMLHTEYDSTVSKSLLGCSYSENIKFFSTSLMDIEQAIEEGSVSCVLLQGLLRDNEHIISIPIETDKNVHVSVIWKKDHYLHPDEIAFIQQLEKIFHP